jgi:hypothetical protein
MTASQQKPPRPGTTPPIVWLASYPKCGNTWVRFMLYAYLYGPPSASIDIPRRIPDLHRPLPMDPPSGPFMLAKTHFALSDRHPSLANTARAIHIIRDPRDVALSALNYRRLATGDDTGINEAAYLRSFIAAGGDADWLRQGFGTWAGHARSWRETERFPVLAVRYEDIKADARGVLVAMLEFLGERVDADRLEAALKASSFDAMRAMEIREKQKPSKDPQSERLFIGDPKATRKGVYFINKGASGQSLDTVAPGLDAAFEAAFGPDMRALGYGS